MGDLEGDGRAVGFGYEGRDWWLASAMCRTRSVSERRGRTWRAVKGDLDLLLSFNRFFS
jgi:hypothetical protein